MKKIVLFGEYLLRLTPPLPQKLLQASELEMHWAGSEANIAVSLSLLGHSAHYITCLPVNDLAKAGITQLQQHGVHHHILWKDSGRVGLYFYEPGSGARAGKVLYDRNHSAFNSLQPGMINWDELFADAGWFHWSGITPALSSQLVNVCKEALKAARKKGIIISADFNYRSTLWQYGKHCSEVMPPLLEYCDVILADVDTASMYFNIQPDVKNLVKSTFLLLQQQLPQVKTIAMTMRKLVSASEYHYTGYIWQAGTCYSSRSYHISEVTERIGTGDAFMAGLIDGLLEQQSPQQIIEFATACGVMKHTISGDFNLATKEEINRLIQQNGSGKIIR